MARDYKTFRAAAIQAAPVFLNLQATVKKCCALIDEAASNGAKLVAFPEAFIPGYPAWIWLGDPGDYGAPFYIELYKNAVEVPSIAVQKLSACARKNRVYACIPGTELDGGSLYLTQFWFNPNGDLIGKHRKMKATNAEKIIWGDGDGGLMPCFETEIGNIGGLMCWENMAPLNVAAMNSQNEQIHVASWPWFFPGDEHPFSAPPNLAVSKTYAIATQSFVIMSSQIFTKEIEDKVCLKDEQRKVFSLGGGCTCIIGPNGKVISEEIPGDKEGIVYADINPELIIMSKYLADPAGHYSNPSLSLNFNQNRSGSVIKTGSKKRWYSIFRRTSNVLSPYKH